MATETNDVSAAAGPPTEQILIGLLTGAWATQTVAAAARLGVPDLLAKGPKTADELARSAGTNASAMLRLLRGLASVGVLERGGGERYALTPVGERLRSDVHGSFRDAFIAETDHVHLRSWEHLADAVRTGLPRPKALFGMPAFDYYAKNPAEGEQFGKAMQNLSRFAADAVLEAYDFSGVRTVMDVGGGSGSLALAVLGRHPHLKGKVVDLPYIGDAARENIRAAGVADRCAFEAADFFRAVPAGADLHVLKSVLHDWTDEECVRILRACREALPSDGRVLVVEMLVPEEIRPDFVMLMDLNMLVMTGGRERTAPEFGKLLSQAGLEMTRVIPTHSPFFLMEGKRRG